MFSRPDPDADTEVGQAHEEHHDVGNEKEVLSALLAPVQAVQVIVPHCFVSHLVFLLSVTLSFARNLTLHLRCFESSLISNASVASL